MSGVEYYCSGEKWGKYFCCPMLIGEYTHTLDAKSRVAIPSKFRTECGEKIILTKGLDSCLFAYPIRIWERMAEKLGGFPLGDARSRGFVRMLLSGAADTDIDKQGRVVIPEYLRSYAGIQKTVIMTGVFDRVEIWDEKRWNAYKQDTERDTESVAQKLGELGLY